MTLDEVMAKVSYRRRDKLRRVLTPKRFDQVMKGLAENRWRNLNEAGRELGASTKVMWEIRSALRVAGILRDWSYDSFSLEVKPRSPSQQRLFTIDGSKSGGYRYVDTMGEQKWIPDF